MLDGLQAVFKTSGPVVIFPASGTGAWEAALVNTLSPGDKVLAFEIGEFARLWAEVARRLGLDVEVVPTRLDAAASIPALVEAKLAADREHRIKAVLVVHNETSTGVDEPACRDPPRDRSRRASGAAASSTRCRRSASIDLRHDEWGIDVTVAGSQKGLMLPPGLSFNAISDEGAGGVASGAAAASRTGRGSRCWRPTPTGFFPYTPSTNLLYGLREALRDAARGRARRTCSRGIAGWPRRRARRCAPGGSRSLCARAEEYSPVVTTVMMPDGHDADAFRRPCSERFNLSLGAGLGRLKGRAFRIGHLGDFNELMLMGTLCGVEMGLGARRRAVPDRAASTPRWTLCVRSNTCTPASAPGERRRLLREKRRDRVLESRRSCSTTAIRSSIVVGIERGGRPRSGGRASLVARIVSGALRGDRRREIARRRRSMASDRAMRVTRPERLRFGRVDSRPVNSRSLRRAGPTRSSRRA